MSDRTNFKEIAKDIVETIKNYKYDYEEIDYDKMYKKWSRILLEWEFMWIEIRIIFNWELWNPCAYIRVPDENKRLKDMVLYEWYDAIPNQTVHWWFTFWKKLKWEDLRSDWVWLGWDYGHCDDYASYHWAYWFKFCENEKKRTVEEILAEIIEQILVFKDKWILD